MLNSLTNYDLGDLEVLLLDSNKHMRLIARSTLHSFGCKSVFEFGDSEIAFEENKLHNIDLIIASWRLEPINGLEFVKRIRTGNDSPNVFVPIIMMSGRSEYQHVIAARDAGANEFLAKPIVPHTLYQRIISLIENPRPFVRSDSFFGPCRRRKVLGPPQGREERRIANQPAASDTPIAATSGSQ